MNKFYCVAVVAFVLLLLPFSAEAQFQFGKNKVVYNPADWVQIESEHFTIYLAKNHFPNGELRVWGAKIRQWAERGYQINARAFKIELTHRPGLVIFADHVSFERTHMQPGLLPEGVAAFADPMALNIAIPLGEPDEKIAATLTHEIVHIFEYEFYWSNLLGRIIRSNAPGWVIEGDANYIAKIFETSTDLLIASLVLEQDQVPSLLQLTFTRGFLVDYALGPLVWSYITDEYGEDKAYEYRVRLKESVRWNPLELVPRVFGVDLVTFDEGFRAYLRKRYLPRLLTKQNIDQIAYPLMGASQEFPRSYSINGTAEAAFFMNSVVSPNGKILAGFGVNYDKSALEIILVSADDGSFVRSLSKNHSYVSDYIYPVGQGITTVDHAGADIAFSPDGNLIAFFGRTEPDRTLFLVDTKTGKIVRRKRLEEFADSPLSPFFALDGRSIVFSATKNVQRDIWIWNLETDEVSSLTHDRAWDFAPIWLNENILAYISVVEGFKKVFTLDLKSGVRSQRTFGQTNETFVVKSLLSERIVVVSDRGGIYNLYDLDIEGGYIKPLTDVSIGILRPSFRVTDDVEEIVVNAPVAGNFRPYRIPSNVEPLSHGTTRGFASAIVPDKRLTPLLSPADIKPVKTKYKFEMGPIYGGYGTGYGYNVLTDISFAALEMPFKDRGHFGRVMSYGPYRFLSYSYVNRHKRFTWGFSASHVRLQGLARDPESGEISSQVFFGTDGVSFIGTYPFSIWRRLELEVGWQSRKYTDMPLSLAGIFRSGSYLRVRTSFVSDTVLGAWFGPVRGMQIRGDIDNGIPLGSLQFTDFTLEMRRYWQITQESVLAARFWGFASTGRDPAVRFFGGQDQVRGVTLWSFSGDRGAYANIEFRVPLIADSSMGPVRGLFFFDIANAGFSGDESLARGFLRLREGKISYGAGLQFYIMPIEVNYDFDSKKFGFLLNRRW